MRWSTNCNCLIAHIRLIGLNAQADITELCSVVGAVSQSVQNLANYNPL